MTTRTSLLAAALLAGCGSSSHHEVDAPPDSGATDLTISVYPAGALAKGPTANASLVAFQDGDGAWQALTGSGGVYHASVTGTRYAVAVACAPQSGFSFVSIYAQTIADATALAADGCLTMPPTAHLTVNIAGIAATEHGEVWVDGNVGVAIGNGPVELDVPKGPTNIFVRRRVTGVALPTALYRASLDVQSDQMVTYDLSAVGAPPELHALTITGADPAETVRVHSSYASGTHFSTQWPVASEEMPRYATVAAASRLPGDVSNATISATRTTGTRIEARIVRLAMSPPREPTVALPARVVFDAPTLDATPLRRATLHVPITASSSANVDYFLFMTTNDSQGLINAMWNVQVRPDWSADPATLTFTTPDLSALPGWVAGMALQTGPVSWSIDRNERNMPYDTPPVDGRTILETETSDTIN